ERIERLKCKGDKMGSVTSDSNKGVEKFLEITKFDHFIDVVISTEANAVEKPNPEVLNPLFDHYDVAPQDVVIVGDTANDMQTGVNAKLGLKIAVLTGVGLEQAFTNADYIIETANDVVEILNQ
ncbi:HAD family hydrolase, partial [Mammaliicoccus sciuri]